MVVARNACSHLIYKLEADGALILVSPLSGHQRSIFWAFKAT